MRVKRIFVKFVAALKPAKGRIESGHLTKNGGLHLIQSDETRKSMIKARRARSTLEKIKPVQLDWKAK